MDREKLEAFLDEKVRPYLQGHYGDMQVLGFENGELSIKFTGQCGGCPSAQITVEEVVEKEVKDAFPEVKKVILNTGVSDELINLARQFLNHEKTIG